VELQQLERRPRAVAAALRLGDPGIVELALEPAGRGEGALLGRFDPHLGVAPTRLAAAGVAVAGGGALAPAPTAHPAGLTARARDGRGGRRSAGRTGCLRAHRDRRRAGAPPAIARRSPPGWRSRRPPGRRAPARRRGWRRGWRNPSPPATG